MLAQPRLADVVCYTTLCMQLALCRIAHNLSVCFSDSRGIKVGSAEMHWKVQRKHISNFKSTELPSQFKEMSLCERGPVNLPLAGYLCFIIESQLLTDWIQALPLDSRQRAQFFQPNKGLGQPPLPPWQCRSHQCLWQQEGWVAHTACSV